MQLKPWSARLNALCLAATLVLTCTAGVAQEAAQSTPQQTPSGGIRLDPSSGPLSPGEAPPAATQAPAAPAPLPEAPRAQQQPPATPPPATAPNEPLGAAAAEQIKTAGGGASRPAGNAIAPTKQHRYRSLMIKWGAVAAAGIAVGTVYGLSRATPSTPPHSASAGAGR